MERPTSPHLSIYKPQITSVLSITHRAAGVALYVGMLVLVGWMVIAAYYPAQYAMWHDYVISPFGRVALMSWTLAFYFHLANGVRHLFWDMGKGYSIAAATRSGWLVVFFTLAMTAGTWGYVYSKMGAV
jgi:succinate dehydrogenase / fumarate reductase cytochrome b subunit